MKRPWFKQPRQLANDPRYLVLSVEGAVAYHAACLHADDDGTLWRVGDRDAVGTLARLLVSRRPGADPAWALAAVEECAEAGLLDLSADGAVLRVVEWVEDAPGTAPEPRRPVPTADERAEAAAAQSAKRSPGRPRKGEAPMSPRERKVRWQFEHRALAIFRPVPAGTTWEAWSTEHPVEAAELLAPRNETRERNPDAGNETQGTGTKPGNETRERNSAGGRAASDSSDSSEASGDENRREKSESSGARPRERNQGTKPGNETPGVGNETPAAPSCSTVETLSAVDAADLIARLGTVVLVEGRTRIFLRGGPQTEMAFVELVRALVRRGHATVDQVVAAFAYGAREEWVAKARRPVDLSRVLEKDGELLVEWLNHVERAPAPKAPTPARPRPLAVDRPALSPAQQAAEIARLKGARSAPNPTATTPTAGATHHG